MLPWFETALDLLFPRSCAGCGGPAGREFRFLCWECMAGLRFIRPPFCDCCGDPLDGDVEGPWLCPACGSGREFARARSAVRYVGVVRRLICDFKYRRATWLGPDLAALLEGSYRAHYEEMGVDAVTCVPLFSARQRARTFNQAELLARLLAARLRLPFVGGAVSRVRDTGTQTHLTARARIANVSAAFKAIRPGRLDGRTLLLVDDVMTTGATVGECAAVIRAAGAAAVHVLTVARG